MWHGPSLADLLGDVSAADAAARPVPGAHTIWELVLHVTAWTRVVRERLGDRPTPEPTPEQDWPPVKDMSAESWRAAVEGLKAAHRELAEDVEALDDAAFVARVPDRDYTVIVMLHGLVEHDTYHGGQIAILKRALGGP